MDGVGKWTSQRVKIGEFKFEKWLNYLEHVSFQKLSYFVLLLPHGFLK